MKTIMHSIVGFLLFLQFTAPSFAADWSPFQIWLREKSGRHIETFKCGRGLGLKIVKDPKTPQHTGRIIACNSKKVGLHSWEGEILSVDDGNVYKGKVKMISATTVEVKGCVLFGVICLTERWTSVKPNRAPSQP